ncbi:MAG: hypothetical protein KF773_27285 [Deltaproteobacteria bacterium]|nr:hypothetical protein [Deltaproteobacteria bacterium]
MAALVAGCVATEGGGDGDEDFDDGGDDGGKADGVARFCEVDAKHTNATFRRYIHRALDALGASDREIAGYTLRSIEDGRVRIDELSDLTCADFQRVRADLPDLHLTNADYGKLKQRGSAVAKAIAGAIDGYMWSNRIYVSRGQDPVRLASTLVHEVNHVLNRSEVGYYDDLPTSAFLHEYRAFHAERLFDAASWAGTDLVDYVITEYELDRSKIPASVLAHPLTPALLPTETAWRKRAVELDEDEPADCTP